MSRVCCLLIVFSATLAAAGEKNVEGVRFFERTIRPLLAKHCVGCHGEKEQQGKLRLDSYTAIIKGGKSGKVVAPGDPQQSLLILAISHRHPDLKMPPENKLAVKEIAALTQWVKRGIPHPDQLGKPNARPKSELIDWKKEREFWAYQPLADAKPPSVRNARWPLSPVDRFLLARMESAGLSPNAPADKRTLIRRATFDLLGVPPTIAEVDRFLKDDSPIAYESLIERLLASPRYGERWGRHWLDVVRYADSNGLDENIAFGNAWRYRDYVIRSFNHDKPYGAFVVEQLAGDLLRNSWLAGKRERLIATGFLSLGPKVLAEVDETKMEMDIIDEQIETVGRTFLAQTWGCARCHDHKFDPVLTEDYYALAGIFKSTRTMEHFRKIARWWENPMPTAADRKRIAEHKVRVKEFEQRIAGSKPGEPKLPALRKQLVELKKNAPQVTSALGVKERETQDVAVHIRGSHLTLGRVVKRRIPLIFSASRQVGFPASQSGRRQLAEWITSRDNPLTWRVIVNRLWRWHFGRGLVATVDHFGQLGETPSHPQLLDWLARRFRDRGGSIKDFHRLVMLSRAYRMSSGISSRAKRIDPQNRMLSRLPVRRLEAEEIRDSLLAAGRLLRQEMGGSLLHVKNREFLFNHTSQDGTSYQSTRRSVYLPVIRNHLYDGFQLFDFNDAGTVNGNRTSTTVAPQALFLMNSELARKSARSLASIAQRNSNTAARIQFLTNHLWSRPPTERESAMFARFVRSFPRRDSAWSALVQAMMISNEFLYVR